MTADGSLVSFKRFGSRRAMPNISDNAQTFKKTQTRLYEYLGYVQMAEPACIVPMVGRVLQTHGAMC